MTPAPTPGAGAHPCLAEIAHDLALGRASFLDPSFLPKRHADAEMNAAFASLFGINQELLRFGEALEAPRDALDIDELSDRWHDFKNRRQAARDRWRARRRQLAEERCQP